MKKKPLIILVTVILVLALVATVLFLLNRSKAPFADLRLEDVAYVEETFGGYPPYPLTGEDQARLVEYLRQVKVTKSKHDWKEYDGAIGQMFVLHMADGRETVVSACSPLFIVDGITYQCGDYDLCQAIQQIYNSYVETIRSESEPVLKP